ncbi:MAG: DUF438 domain-containing protein [Anaerolineaceae bacterium]|nr:DUF438 domain-containing protein [Anaerolineaceae bacterium]
MSEYIDNVSRRKETLRNVLRQLHAGKTVEEVKAEFGALALEASYNEIAETEQMLIDEGLPVSEIQNLCDVHVAVFRDGLDKQQQAAPDSTPGHPIHSFLSENRILESLLETMENTLIAYGREGNKQQLVTFQLQLAKLAEIDKHYLRKENLLFPYLEGRGFTGPSKVMWGVHDQIRARLKALAELAASNAPHKEITSRFQEVSAMLQEMVYKEEKILIPASIERLTDMEWYAIRRQENGFGYFLFAPGDWKPEGLENSKPAVAASEPVYEAGELPLQTGDLTLEQINMMLTNLPVDVTYVDENDEVRYFTQGKDRIFDRTAAIIGRKVQNCHPPQSVDKVERILKDFRAGTRSVAEFWIQMGPRFIHIRYFPLRDAANNYRGTIEVSQDVAGIRALQGERRLLDD